MDLSGAPWPVRLADMALHDVRAKLEQELDLLSMHFRDFAATKSLQAPTDFSILDECLLEGLLSRVWQAWNIFCRNCVIESCVGTTDAAGVTIAGLPTALTEAHVSAAAIAAKKGRTRSYWTTTNTLLRAEPTWGDVDVLIRILTGLVPTNAATMLAAFSSSYQSAKAIQTIRNGAAHNHIQNMNEIQNLRSAYLVFPISHATHAMFWTVPNSGDFLVTHAINELKFAGIAAIT